MDSGAPRGAPRSQTEARLIITPYLRTLASNLALTTTELERLAASGVRHAADVHSLLTAFPSMCLDAAGTQVMRRQMILDAVAAAVPARSAPGNGDPAVALGAGAPADAMARGPSGPPRPLVNPQAQNLIMPGAVWSVRNQFLRGTCVAFAATAALELVLGQGGQPGPFLSEEFLYWAIKTQTADRTNTADWTWLRFARDAFAQDGVLEDSTFPYLTPLQNPVSGPAPDLVAKQAAAAHCYASAVYTNYPDQSATRLYDCLASGHPAAISMAVFADPVATAGHPTNWGTTNVWNYGVVHTPPVNAKPIGGHSVCVVGFVPDATESLGGYFIIRNSWGTAWASEQPSAFEPLVPRPGYGALSASYVDAWCRELLEFR
jgi:Papain family cysteine protease